MASRSEPIPTSGENYPQLSDEQQEQSLREFERLQNAQLPLTPAYNPLPKFSMRIRLLVTALTYAVFLLTLLLFPPFHDSLHHFYTWRPNEDQLFAMAPDWLNGDLLHDQLPALALPDHARLVFESLIGLVSTTFIFLLLELISRWRLWRRQDLPFCKSTLLGFFFDTP